MKNNKSLFVLVVVLCLLIGGLGGYIICDKVLNKDATNNVNDGDVDNTVNNVNKDNKFYIHYSFGDEVIISKMSSVKGFIAGNDNETVDFSLWHVLSDNDNIVTLLSDNVWGKDFTVKDYSNVFRENGVTIEKSRGLNESELELLGCDIRNMSCTNSPSFAKPTITSVVSEKSVIVFDGDKLSTMPIDDGLVPVRPVIVITKSNLESAK